MRQPFAPGAPGIPLLTVLLIGLLCTSCVKGVYTPVNVGREYGNPKVPLMVSHLPVANQWVLRTSHNHYFLSKILCFDYICRKKIGRRKALKAISFEEFKRRVRKNAKKGEYKQYKLIAPVPKTIQPDTSTVKKVPERIAEPAAVPAADAPILKADSLIILSEVLFELNSYSLKSEHIAALDSLGKFLKSHPTLEVIVSGHTDNTGTERHNVSLSTRRAEVVLEYLVDHGAVFEQVAFEGFGSSQPIESNETPQGRSKNRRVEILIRNPKK